MPVTDQHLVFVYGTLKRGCRNHGWMRGGFFVGEALTEPNYRMYDLGGYPGLYRVETGGVAIRGELWRVSDEVLDRLDILEDVAGGDYAHERIPLEPPWEKVEALGYICLLPIDGCPDVGAEWLELG